ncbi:hypothetical protein J3F83DRAFT_740209 [Trichoderma novae-zelandiae]
MNLVSVLQFSNQVALVLLSSSSLAARRLHSHIHTPKSQVPSSAPGYLMGGGRDGTPHRTVRLWHTTPCPPVYEDNGGRLSCLCVYCMCACMMGSFYLFRFLLLFASSSGSVAQSFICRHVLRNGNHNKCESLHRLEKW